MGKEMEEGVSPPSSAASAVVVDARGRGEEENTGTPFSPPLPPPPPPPLAEEEMTCESEGDGGEGGGGGGEREGAQQEEAAAVTAEPVGLDRGKREKGSVEGTESRPDCSAKCVHAHILYIRILRANYKSLTSDIRQVNVRSSLADA